MNSKQWKETVRKYLSEKKIDKSAVMDAATDAAEDIFGKKEVDLELVGDVVEDAIKKAKETEDAIQIAIDMMRSK